MFANQNVHMVRHNDACVAGEFLVLNCLCERIGKLLSHNQIKRSPWMFQGIRGFIQKLANNDSGRLNPFSTVMQLAEFSENIVADAKRAAAARIVGKPMAIRGPNEVMRDDDGVSHHVLRRNMLSAKPQAEMQTAIAACGLALAGCYHSLGAYTNSLKRLYPWRVLLSAKPQAAIATARCHRDSANLSGNAANPPSRAR